jgi:hypothetical protein
MSHVAAKTHGGEGDLLPQLLRDQIFDGRYSLVTQPRDLSVAYHRGLWASEVGVLQMCDCSYHQRACRQVYCRQLKDSDSKVSQLTKAEHKERRAWLRVRGNRECPIFPSRGGPGYRESGWML